MNSAATIRLAADILADHFGNVVSRVGTVLLERGALSLADILRFANPGTVGFGVGEDPLTFVQVRNVLLTLVQHGIVDTRPQYPQAPPTDNRSLLRLYSIDVEEVLARARFPHFLENVQCNLGEAGDLAYDLLYSVLRYGRVSASVAVAEAQRSMRGQASVQDCEDMLRRLVQERYLRVVEPFHSRGASSSSSSSAAAPSASPKKGEGTEAGGSAEGQGQKRKREEGGGADGGDASPGAPQQQQQAVVAAERRDNVYCYDRSMLNLSICKNLLCRVVCERVSNYAGQVLAVLLSGVHPRSPKDGQEPPTQCDEAEHKVDVGYMPFAQIEGKMKAMGFTHPGRDPTREGERLRKALDLLSAHSDGLLRKRTTKGVESLEVMIPEGPHKNQWFRCTVTGPGAKPGCKDVQVAEPEIMAEFSNVPPQAMRRRSLDVAEWGVEWVGARRLITNVAISQLLRDQFGTVGLRIFNCLNERNPPQKMEEKDIFSTCMVPPSEGREVLNEMVRRFIIHWQEVPRSANTPLAASYWLYYVDRRRVKAMLLQNAMQAALNLRIRFRVESAKVVPLEARQDSLTAKERADLKAGRRVEDILERSFLVLDTAILVFRSF